MLCYHRLIKDPTDPDGPLVPAIVCIRGDRRSACVVCSRTVDIVLCDFPLTGPKTGQTCSRPVCRLHATHEEPDTDYCPTHARLRADAGTP